MKGIAMAVLLMTVSWVAGAKSFGVVGRAFPVGEMSFLAMIEERLKALEGSGEMDALNKRWVNTVATHSNRPSPLNLPRTLKTRGHYYTPAIALGQSINDSQGKILFAKGTTVNALKDMPSYTPCWLFFNADDEAQLLWAQKQMSRCANPKLILTGGAVGIAEKTLQAVIYFDQAGRISTKLSIAAVPARVTRKGNQLQITEQAIKENGDVL
jgi:conjugal transfer pilus assembly protein TraW